MQIKLKSGVAYHATKFLAKDIPVRFVNAGTGDWFYPDQITEITDDPPQTTGSGMKSAQEVCQHYHNENKAMVNCLEEEKKARRAVQELLQARTGEASMLLGERNDLQREVHRLNRNLTDILSRLERVRNERDGMSEEIKELRQDALKLRKIIAAAHGATTQRFEITIKPVSE